MAKRVSRKSSAGGRARPSGLVDSARLIVMDLSERIREIRDRQLAEGNFDCYGKAGQGYCDRGDCLYKDECLVISSPAPATVPVGKNS
jgi:hypothetical protein